MNKLPKDYVPGKKDYMSPKWYLGLFGLAVVGIVVYGLAKKFVAAGGNFLGKHTPLPVGDGEQKGDSVEVMEAELGL